MFDVWKSGKHGSHSARRPRHTIRLLMFVVFAVSIDTRTIGELAGSVVGSTIGPNVIISRGI
jgi:hypothetical protein